jgi:hypothetical protein
LEQRDKDIAAGLKIISGSTSDVVIMAVCDVIVHCIIIAYILFTHVGIIM